MHHARLRLAVDGDRGVHLDVLDRRPTARRAAPRSAGCSSSRSLRETRLRSATFSSCAGSSDSAVAPSARARRTMRSSCSAEPATISMRQSDVSVLCWPTFSSSMVKLPPRSMTRSITCGSIIESMMWPVSTRRAVCRRSLTRSAPTTALISRAQRCRCARRVVRVQDAAARRRPGTRRGRRSTPPAPKPRGRRPARRHPG